MKKQILISFLVLAIAGSASSAMATTSISGEVTIGAGNTFTPSAKVGIKIISAVGSYAPTSCHMNGTKEYGTVGGTGTTQDPSKIYSQAIPSQTGATSVGVPDDPASAIALSGTSWE